MLLLSRRVGEKILIGEEIQIKVLSVSEAVGSVRIEIEAPDPGAVHSKEVDSEVSDRKAGPVVTHKRRWRSLLTK